jgi:hypothetical protein
MGQIGKNTCKILCETIALVQKIGYNYFIN